MSDMPINVTAEGERIAELERELTRLRAECEGLRKALAPFAHPDLCEVLSGSFDDDSPIYGRNNALLVLGDFRRARAAINAQGGG